MKVALLAGDRNGLDQIPTRALEVYEGELLLDRQIRDLQSLGLEIVTILNFGDCESILRASRLLAECELIFDPNDTSDFFSQLSAAALGCDERFFVLPLHTPAPSKPTWLRLEHHFYKKAGESESHVFQPFCPRKGDLLGGFPLLITRAGIKIFRSGRNFTALSDTRLELTPVPVLDAAVLAQFPKPSQPLRALA